MRALLKDKALNNCYHNKTHLKTGYMGSILYIIAVLLIIGWILGFFVYSAGSIIHLLLVIAVIAILIQIISGRRSI